MSKISSTDKVVTQAQLKEDLQNFYEQIRPFLNGEPGMNLDSTPTQNSTNGATSGGIYTALSGKQNTLTAGTGIAISGNTISAPVNYSTSEHVVGTWIDGKPIYEKTISCGALPNATTKIVAHNISNVDHIIDYHGISMNPTSYISVILPYPGGGLDVTVFVDRTNIKIITMADNNNYTATYVTLQYTKTTD